MTTLPVYVIGFGDLYHEFFNAIAATMGNSDYHTLLKLMVILGGGWTLALSACRQQLTMNIRWLLTYFALTSVILLPNARVIIQDRTGGPSYTVQSIPLGLALLANLTTSVGTGFTELVESVFHTPNDLSYTQSGMLMGARMVTAGTRFEVSDSAFKQSLESFVKQCVFYDVLLHKYSLDTLRQQPNIWHFISQQASPVRAFVYHDTIISCQAGAAKLNRDWQQALHDSHWIHRFPWLNTTQASTNAKAQLLSYLTTSYQQLAHLSENAAELMQQSMMIHALRDSAHTWVNSFHPSLSSLTLVKAQAQKREGYHLLYQLAVYWLPLTKAAMELVLLGASLIGVLLMLFPFGTQLLKNYVMTFIWLQLWPPLFAY